MNEQNIQTERKTKVLIADDEVLLGELLCEGLRYAGYETEVVCDGEAACLKIRENHYDVVLLDVCMPKMNGLQTMDEVSDVENRPEFIVMSGFTTPAQVAVSIRLGAFLHLEKPVPLKTITHTIEQAIHRDRDGEQIVIHHTADGWVEITAPSHKEYIYRLEGFLSHLQVSLLDETQRKELETALRETLANAIEWGNSEAIDKQVRISYRFKDGVLVIRVIDQGRGFSTHDSPAPLEDPLDQLDHREEVGKRPGGYGLSLIRRCMDHVEFNEAGNEITMTKTISGMESKSS